MAKREARKQLSPEGRQFRRKLAVRFGPPAAVLLAIGLWLAADLASWRLMTVAVLVFYAGFLVSVIVMVPELGDETVRIVTEVVDSPAPRSEQEREALLDRVERTTARYPNVLSLLTAVIGVLSLVVAALALLL